MMDEKGTDIPGNSNKELRDVLAKRFNDVFWQALSLLEVAFPHDKGDGSENEKKFNAIRGKVLRVGNDAVRDLDPLLESYVVFQMFEYQRRTRPDVDKFIFDFRQNYVILSKDNKNGGKDNGTGNQ